MGEEIIQAAQRGDIELIQQLLALDNNNERDIDEALRWSASRGYLEVVKVLLEHGATNNGGALLLSASTGYLEVVKVLLEHGATNNGGALLLSARYGHLEVVKFLLEHGATAPVNFAHNNLLNDPEVQAKREFILKFKESGFAHKAINNNLITQLEHYYEQFLRTKKLVHSDESIAQFNEHQTHLSDFYHANHDATKEQFLAFCMGLHKKPENTSPVQMLNRDIAEVIWKQLLPFPEDRAVHQEILSHLTGADKDVHNLFLG